MTKTSVAKLKANKKYISKQDEFKIRLPHGSKEKITNHIKKTADSSVNAFFARAVIETIERDLNSKK